MTIKNLYRTTIDLDKESVAKFRQHYPQRGALNWFFNSCLAHFVSIHTFNEQDEINAAVEKALVSHLNSESKEEEDHAEGA